MSFNPNTNSFPPVEGQGYYQQPAPSSQPPARSGNAVVITLLVVVIVLLAAGLGWFVYKDSVGTQAVEDEQPTTITYTEVVEEEPDTAPAGADPAPAQAPAQAPAPGGSLSSAWAGSSNTSTAFVNSVHREYVRYRNNTGNTSGTITAYSPTTGQTYTMNCTPNGGNITCRGGNNAVVHIGG